MNSVPWNHLLAVWLGLLCAASPCPMATNLAAVGFLPCERERGQIRFLIAGVTELHPVVHTAHYEAVVIGHELA